MKNIDAYTSNKEARNEMIREGSKSFAEEMRKLQSKDDENKREESLKETSEKLASYMKELEDK